ncbi:unnamed protein product [Ascophyllum nodosum]
MAPLRTFARTIAGEALSVTYVKTALKSDLSYLPAFNNVGGRRDERRGTRGSFTPGVLTMSGGKRRDVPLEAKINPGEVLSVSDTLEPDLSGQARTNALRKTERLGVRGGFAPGVKIFSGGVPRDLALKARNNPDLVLFSSCSLEPNITVEARTKFVRPAERFGSGGRFTRGIRHWLGGSPRDVPVKGKIDHGEVLAVSSKLKPDLSWAGETNVLGGRGGERLGRMGSFKRGVIQVSGGSLRMPPAGNLSLRLEPGQTENKIPRCGPYHFVAGVSMLSSGMPTYMPETV